MTKYVHKCDQTLKGFRGWRTLSGLILKFGSKPRVLVPRTPGWN